VADRVRLIRRACDRPGLFRA